MTDEESEKIRRKAEPKPVRDRIIVGVLLSVLALVLLSGSVPVLGLISGAAAIYQFVVAAIAQGVKEGREK